MNGSLDLDSDEGEDDFTDTLNSGNAKLTTGLIDGDFKGIHNQYHQQSNVKNHLTLINKNDLNRHKPLHRTYHHHHHANGNYLPNVSMDYDDEDGDNDTDDEDNVDIGKVIISIGDRVSNNRDNQSSSGSSVCDGSIPDEQLTISSSGSKVNSYRPLPHSYHHYYHSHHGSHHATFNQLKQINDNGTQSDDDCVIVNGVCCNIGNNHNQELTTRDDYRSTSSNSNNNTHHNKEGEMDSETSVLLNKETDRRIKEIDLSNCSTANSNNTNNNNALNSNSDGDVNSIGGNQTSGRSLHNQPHTISCRPLSESSSIAQLSIASSLTNDPNAPMCKICHLNAKEMDPLITPCRCAGTMRYIHCGCLMRWLEISSKRTRKPLACELCQYKYQWHKKFKVRQCQLPHCSRRDKILHSLFFFSITIMIACTIMAIMCFKHNKGHRIDPNRTELTDSEITTLICGVIFFLAFFLAMYVEVKARNTLYKLFFKFIYLNQQWYIDEYEKKDPRPVDI